MKNYFHILITFLIVNSISAQADTSKPSLSFSGYAEVYYSYDLGQPDNHNRPSFFYNHNRHNEFNLNLGFIKASYNTERVRANLALAAGTYMNANYANETGVYKNVFEANAGFKLFKTLDLWLDAGIFPSHIGFETAISTQNWNLTRSLVADNSPYYETGAKLTYKTDNGKLLLSALILNGWQRIQRPDGIQIPSFGTQVTFSPNSYITLNHSSYLGNERVDSLKQFRYYQNFYGICNLVKNLHVTLGFDYGAEQKSEGSNEYNTWYSPVFIVKLDCNYNFSIAARAEYFRDKNGIIIPTGTSNGLETFGYSFNIDYKLRNNALWRLEGRMLNNKDKIFILEDKPSQNNYFITSSIAVSF